MNLQEAERIFRTRIKAPQKYLFASAEDKPQQLKACKENKGNILLAFVDSFRKMIDFSIPALKSADSDYEEYKNDPKIPLLPFSENIENFTKLCWTSFPASIVLLRRLIKYIPSGKISVNNMHRLMVASLMLADKFIEDIPPCNETFANSAQISCDLIQQVENEFVRSLNYDVFINWSEICEVLTEWGFSCS
jgi:hypothetical protein